MEQEFSLKHSSIWIRLIFTLLYLFLLQLAVTVFVWVAVIQWVYTLATGGASETLRRFGASLAEAIAQAVKFVIFADEEKPFPFQDWPDSGIDSE